MWSSVSPYLGAVHGVALAHHRVVGACSGVDQPSAGPVTGCL